MCLTDNCVSSLCESAVIFLRFFRIKGATTSSLLSFTPKRDFCQRAVRRSGGRTRKGIEGWEDTRAKGLCSSCSCLVQTPPHLHPSPLPPPPPPPQLAPFKSKVTVSERSALFEDELQLLLLLLFVSPSLSLSVFLHPPPPSPFLFDFLRGFFVGVTPLNGTMQPSVKLKLLVSLELLKRGFYTCMHSYTLPYAIDIAN